MDFSLEERSELRQAILCLAGDPSTSAGCRRILRSAYGKLAKADGLDETLTISATSRRNRDHDIRPLQSVGDIVERLFPAVEAELRATAEAVISLDDRVARSPLIREGLNRTPARRA